MEGILTALIGGLCVAVPNIVATIVNNKKNNMDNLKSELKKEFNKSISDLETKIKNKFLKLEESQNEEKLDRCKVDLINTMSRVQNGYTLTEEERRILIEEKSKYNKLGGDSYVDDMFDRLKKEGKL